MRNQSPATPAAPRHQAVKQRHPQVRRPHRRHCQRATACEVKRETPLMLPRTLLKTIRPNMQRMDTAHRTTDHHSPDSKSSACCCWMEAIMPLIFLIAANLSSGFMAEDTTRVSKSFCFARLAASVSRAACCSLASVASFACDGSERGGVWEARDGGGRCGQPVGQRTVQGAMRLRVQRTRACQAWERAGTATGGGQ